MAHPATSLTTLPPELIHLIITTLHTTNLNRALASLALTSHTLLHFCAPVLYSNPTIDLSPRTATALRLILPTPRAAHISSLTLHWHAPPPRPSPWLTRPLLAPLHLTTFTLAYDPARSSADWHHDLQCALSAAYPAHHAPALFPHLRTLRLLRVEANAEILAFLRHEVSAGALRRVELRDCFGRAGCGAVWASVFRALGEWVLTRSAALEGVDVWPVGVAYGSDMEGEEGDWEAERVKRVLHEGRAEGVRMFAYVERYRVRGGSDEARYEYVEDVAENRRQALAGEDWAAWTELQGVLVMPMEEREKVAAQRERALTERNRKMLGQVGVVSGRVPPGIDY